MLAPVASPATASPPNSKAVAVATLEQKAEQDNENSAEAELVAPTRNIPIEENFFFEADGEQSQGIEQINLNAQLGLAIADADAGDVEVRSSQDPSFGDGINAEFIGLCQG